MPSSKRPATSARPYRVSRFKEASMNSRTSIHTPPRAYMDDQQHFEQTEKSPEELRAEGAASAASQQAPSNGTKTSSHGPFGRVGHFFSSIFTGKQKDDKDNKKEAVANAKDIKASLDRDELLRQYQQLKDAGAFKPTVYVRPQTRHEQALPVSDPSSSAITFAFSRPEDDSLPAQSPRSSAPTLVAPSEFVSRVPIATRTSPTRLCRTPRRDIAYPRSRPTAEKLARRVSNLEAKLAEARRDLTMALAEHEPDSPTQSEISVEKRPSTASPLSRSRIDSATSIKSTGTVLRKRKAESSIPTPMPSTPTSRGSKKQKRVSKLRKMVSSPTLRDEIKMVVPDGVVVPPVPHIPVGIQGKRADVIKEKENDGFGGYGHEIF